MARKTKQFGVRMEPPQATRLEKIAVEFHNTPSGLVRLAVDCLIETYDQTGELLHVPQDAKRKHSDNLEATAAAGGER